MDGMVLARGIRMGGKVLDFAALYDIAIINTS